jgi:hypothetical protein
MEAVFGVFVLFFIANIVMVIWALVDAIRVPDDSMYKAGNKLIWVLVVGRPEPGHRPAGPGSIDPGAVPPPPPGALG